MKTHARRCPTVNMFNVALKSSPNLGEKMCATKRLVSASIFASELHYCSRVFSLGDIEFRPRGGEEISQKAYNYSK